MTYNKAPKAVKAILDSFNQDADEYRECARIEQELNSIGFSCEWYLDGEIFNLHKL